MKIISKALIHLALGTAVLGSACSKDKSEPAEKTKAPETAKAIPEVPTKTNPKVKKPVANTDQSFAADLMFAYEECRERLARDSTEGIGQCAEDIAARAKMADETAPDAAHASIAQIIVAAEAMQKLEGEDIADIRLAFGEVSKATVAMLTAAPEAAKSYHVFECPMAKGYKRWAQPGSRLENPYMGKKMLSCGDEVHDHHKGMKEDGAKEKGEHAGHAH